MKFKLPRKLKKFLSRNKWVEIKTGKPAYPANSQLDYEKYQSGELAPVSNYIPPTG